MSEHSVESADTNVSQEGALRASEPNGRSGSIFTRLYNGETAFGFINSKRYFFLFSILVIVIGASSLAIRGLNFGIDFKGGTSWEVPSQTLSVSKAKAVLSADGISQSVVVSLGSKTGRTIQAEADLSELGVSQRTAKEVTVAKALARAGGVSYSAVGISDVGPTWGSEITSKALRALVFFFLGIVIYISLRFEWKMAAAALVAVVHDLAVTVGIYSLANFQITPATVIAILTILGYSLYDTIVVFDRVQENTKALVNTGRMTYSDSVNLSLNQVLMRSLNTSIVAIIPVLSILVVGAYILGATTLQDFGLALFVGLTTGAYSSIGVASPLLAIFKERETRYTALKARLGSRGRGELISPRQAALAVAGSPFGSSRTPTSGTGSLQRPRAQRKASSKRKATKSKR